SRQELVHAFRRPELTQMQEAEKDDAERRGHKTGRRPASPNAEQDRRREHGERKLRAERTDQREQRRDDGGPDGKKLTTSEGDEGRQGLPSRLAWQVCIQHAGRYIPRGPPGQTCPRPFTLEESRPARTW